MRWIELSAGRVRYADMGAGPTLVFVHGLLVDHRIWSGVIERLAPRFRCVAPDLPLGSHPEPMRPGADLSLAGQAAILGELLDALDLRDVTLVGNDTGGAVCQLLAGEAPARVAALVLTDCDAFEVFPPPGFRWLLPAGRVPGLPALTFRLLRAVPSLLRLPLAYGALTHGPMDDALPRAWVGPAATDPAIRRDLLGLLRGAGPAVTLGAAERLHRFPGPSLLLWSRDDPFFAASLAERLAERLRDAEITWLDRASLLVPLDRPDAVADGVARFHEGRVASRPAARA